MNNKLLAQVRHHFAQCVFMSNIHYKAYYRLDKVLKFNQILVTTLSALTLGLIILNLVFLESSTDKSVLRILYILSLAVTATGLIYELFNKKDIGELKFKHRNSAEEYKTLRDQYMSLIEETMSSSMKEKDLRLKLGQLNKEYGYIGKAASTTENSDYSDAQSALGIADKKDEEFTWSDEEIDNFLPASLRIGNIK